MFNPVAAFSGFSVDDIKKAEEFYEQTLGLKKASNEMGLTFELPGGGKVFMYPKPDHKPATFTVLNLVVSDITEAVDELTKRGISFEQYKDGPVTDEKGIAWGSKVGMGPDIAWFKDPAGNILSVLQD